MYSTCIFCHASLGSNDAIEAFPVGRRLAFDSAKGRLWVICERCGRWNLSPIEERWEAIERCQRLSRSVRPRAASEHIALVDLPEGVRLVRVGAPSWHELASWRYGALLRMRRRWANVRQGGRVVAERFLAYAAAPALAPVIGWPAYLLCGATIGALEVAIHRRMERRPVAQIVGADGVPSTLRRGHLRAATLDPAEAHPADWRLVVPSDGGPLDLVGPDALRVAGLALARQNRDGGAAIDIEFAVRWVAEAGSGEAYLAGVTRRVAAGRGKSHPLAGTRLEPQNDFAGPLARLPDLTRLALEIAVSDEIERRALGGELESLERAWRDAEEVAAIADSLLVPSSVQEGLDRLRRRGR